MSIYLIQQIIGFIAVSVCSFICIVYFLQQLFIVIWEEDIEPFINKYDIYEILQSYIFYLYTSDRYALDD